MKLCPASDHTLNLEDWKIGLDHVKMNSGESMQFFDLFLL